jgi:hypothetical protein
MVECRSLRLACLNGLAVVLFLFSASAHTQLQAFAAIFEPEPDSEYAQQQAQSVAVAKARRQDHANPRRSPLPSVREIDAALERKYGAPRYREF